MLVEGFFRGKYRIKEGKADGRRCRTVLKYFLGRGSLHEGAYRISHTQ